MPVNIGNPEEWTVLDCAREVITVTGSTSGIGFSALPVDDPVRRKPDITMAKELLQWEPQVGLREGLERSLEYFKGCLDGKTMTAK